MAIELRQGDCLHLIKDVADNSIDCILTDPPYLYLKHKLDRNFDEDALFAEFWRVLKPRGFVVLFGRGVSLARWVCKLDALGFKFKEEVVWHKVRNTSPVLALGRTHETVYIFSKQGGRINKARITFEEACVGLSAKQVEERLRRPLSSIQGTREIEDIKRYLEEGIQYLTTSTKKFKVTHNLAMTKRPGVSAMASLFEGFRENSVMTVPKDYFKTIHPTEKPVRLLERLLALISQEGAMVLDPFAGSGSTLVACRNTGRSALGFEIDEEYYIASQERLNTLI